MYPVRFTRSGRVRIEDRACMTLEIREQMGLHSDSGPGLPWFRPVSTRLGFEATGANARGLMPDFLPG